MFSGSVGGAGGAPGVAGGGLDRGGHQGGLRSFLYEIEFFELD